MKKGDKTKQNKTVKGVINEKKITFSSVDPMEGSEVASKVARGRNKDTSKVKHTIEASTVAETLEE